MRSIWRYGNYLTMSLTFLFLYLPIFVLIAFSFNSRPFPQPFEHFTLHWYRELFATPELWQSFSYSALVATCSTLLSLTLGLMLVAMNVYGTRIKRSIPLFYGNLVIPETVLALALISFFSLCNVPLGLHTLIISHTVIALGFVVPILFIRYKAVDKRLIEASLVLGATPTQTFFRVILPQLKPAIISVGLLVFVVSFDDFILSYFCSGSSIETLSIYLVNSLRFGISPVVNALSTLLLIATGIAATIFFSPKVRTRVF